MKDRLCPHCHSQYHLELINGRQTFVCPTCRTYLDFAKREYSYIKSEAPDYISDSFKALRRIMQHPHAIVVSKHKPFDKEFSLKDVQICDPSTGAFVSESMVTKVRPPIYNLIGLGGHFAYGSLDIMREAVSTGASVNPFNYPEGATVERLLFMPIVTKVMMNNTMMSLRIEKAISKFFRITLEGKVAECYGLFNTSKLPEMSDEYLLLSSVALNPFIVIGTKLTQDDIDTSVKAFIKAYVKMDELRDEVVDVPLADPKAMSMYRERYLSSMPSTAVNRLGDTFVDFDIYEHATYVFTYKKGDTSKCISTLGYMRMLEELCKYYMGSELSDLGIPMKRSYLESLGLDVPMDNTDIVKSFWHAVDSKLN